MRWHRKNIVHQTHTIVYCAADGIASGEKKKRRKEINEKWKNDSMLRTARVKAYAMRRRMEKTTEGGSKTCI